VASDVGELDEAMAAEVARLYRRYLHAATMRAAEGDSAGVWFGMAHGFRESARSLGREVAAQRRLREYRQQMAVAR